MTPLVTSAAVAFWMLAPVMVLAGAGVVLARRPIHSALCLAVVMVSLAIQYAALDAPFLFVVQIIVYTGAILMLFLFVVMLVGVDTADSPVETIRHHRVPAVLFGLGLGALIVLGLGNALTQPSAGLEFANRNDGGNIQGLANLIFARYVVAFEATAALLITAALGAMVLAHRERLTPKRTQKDHVTDRMRRYAESGEHPGNLPNPGVYARHNGIATPALLPDGTISELSVSTTLRERGQVMDPTALARATEEVHATIVEGRDDPALAPGYSGPRGHSSAVTGTGPRTARPAIGATEADEIAAGEAEAADSAHTDSSGTDSSGTDSAGTDREGEDR